MIYLPIFDLIFLGYKNRNLIIDPLHEIVTSLINIPYL